MMTYASVHDADENGVAQKRITFVHQGYKRLQLNIVNKKKTKDQS